MSHPSDVLIAELCENLRIVAALHGLDSPRARRMLVQYRAVADELGCRDALEEALLREILQAGDVDDRDGGMSPAVS